MKCPASAPSCALSGRSHCLSTRSALSKDGRGGGQQLCESQAGNFFVVVGVGLVQGGQCMLKNKIWPQKELAGA